MLLHLSRLTALCALAALTACAQTPMKLTGTKQSATAAMPPAARQVGYLLMHVEGLLLEKDARFQSRVFLDFPEATADTPAEHPAYIGMITLLGSSKPSPRNIILPVPEKLGRALRGKAKVTVTLLPESPELGKATIARFRLETVR